MDKQHLARERTLLAAERTFSAWIRTGLTGMAGGVTFLRFITFKNPVHRVFALILGYMLIAWGGMLFILAAAGYRRAWQQLLPHYTQRHALRVKLALVIVPLICTVAILLAIAAHSHIQNYTY